MPGPGGPARRPAGRRQIPDDRLRLIVTCCHPALDRSAQVALTLRLMCGLSTAEVARAFLVSEPTMAARITRAKKKIAVARIPYRVPAADELPERVDAVLVRRAPAVHHRPHDAGGGGAGPPRPRRAVGAAVPDAARAAAAGPGRGRAARAAAAHRRPAGDPHGARRPAAAARGAGPLALGPPGHRARARRWCGRRCGPARRRATPCRPRSPRSTPSRRPGTTPTGPRSSRCTTS